MRTFAMLAPRLLAVVAGSLATLSVANGQLVTAPPSQAPAPDAHIERLPEPVRPPARPQIDPEELKKMAKPVTGHPESPKKDWPKAADLPKMEYKPLAQMDAQGHVKPLGEPVEHVAMRANPMLPAGFFDGEKVKTYLAERRATIERLVVDNADICQRLDEGLVEKADLAAKDNKAVLSTLSAAVKPLSAGGTSGGVASLHVEMYQRGLISPVQAAFAEMMINEYTKALLKDQPTAELMKTVLKSPTAEAMWTYHALCAEAAGKLQPATAGMALSGPAGESLQAAAKNYQASLTQDQKLKVYRDATASLTPDQRKALLQKVVSLRGAK